MEQSPGLLDSIGFVSGLVAGGAALHSTLQTKIDVMGAKTLFATARNTAAEKVFKTPTVRTAAEAGLTKAMGFTTSNPVTTRQFGTDLGAVTSFLKQTKAYGAGTNFEHTAFLKEVGELTKGLSGRSYYLEIASHVGNNHALSIVTGKNKIEFDMLTRGGKYARTQFGLSYGNTPRFWDMDTFKNIVAGKQESFDFSKATLGYNEFIAREQRKMIGYGKFGSTAPLVAAKKYVHTNALSDMTNPISKIVSSKAIPLNYDPTTGMYGTFNAVKDTEMLRDFQRNFSNLVGKQNLNKYIGLLNYQHQAIGSIHNPALIEGLIPGMSGSITGEKMFPQFFKETMAPSSLAPKSLKNPVGNLMNIPTYIDSGAYWETLMGKGQKSLMDTVLESGFGTGFATPGIGGQEGVLMAKGLASQKITTTHGMNINIAADIDLHGVESLIDETVLQYLGKSETHAINTLPSNRARIISDQYGNIQFMDVNDMKRAQGMLGGYKNQNKIRGYRKAIRSMTTDQKAEWRTFSNSIFSDMTTIGSDGSTKASKLFKGMGGMAFNKRISNTQTGSQRLGRFGNEKIFDIISGGQEEGFRLSTKSTSSLGGNFKTWYSRKQIGNRLIDDPTRLFKNIFSLQSEITSSSNPRQMAGQIFGALESGNFDMLNEIVGRQSASMDPTLLRASKNMIFSAENIRKGDPTILFTSMEETFAQLGFNKTRYKKGSSLEEKIMMNKRKMERLITQAKGPEKAKYKALFETLIGNKEGMLMPGLELGSVLSVDEPRSMYGFGKQNINFSTAEALKFKQYGMKSIHDQIVGNFKMEEYQNILDAYSPLIDSSKTTKGARTIDISSLGAKDAEILFGEDLAASKLRAREIFTIQEGIAGRKIKNVSDQTKFLIRLSEEATIPILDFKSTSYIGNVNKLTEMSSAESIPKLLSKLSIGAVRAAQYGSESGIGIAMDDLMSGVGRVLGNPSIFTKQPIAGMALENRYGNLLNQDWLETLRSRAGTAGNEGAFNTLLEKHGIDINNPLQRRAGMSSSDYGSFKSLFPEGHKGPLYAFGGRDPVGYGAWMNIDAESFLTDANVLQGKGLKESQIEARAAIQSGGLYTNVSAEALLTADMDRDRIKMAAITEETSIKEAKQFVNKTQLTADRLSAGKGGIKIGQENTIMFDEVMETLRNAGERTNINYEKALAYERGIGPLSLRMEELRGFASTVDKETIFMTDVLRETGIGGKGYLGESLENIDEFIKIMFDPKQKLERRLSIFKKVLDNTEQFKTPEGMNYFQQTKGAGYEPYLKSMLGNFDEYRKTQAAAVARGVSKIKYSKTVGMADLRNLMRSAETAGPSGNLIPDMISDAALQGSGKFKRGITGAGTIAEIGAGKIWKNPVFKVAAAIGIAATLLRPANSNIKHQDVMNQSRTKGRRLAGAEAIDPDVGSVYKAAAPGYKMNIRGNLPRNVNPDTFRSQISMLGIPTSGGILNRDAAADQQYLQNIQYDNNSLQWNNG